jgi:hypothetical protein
MVHSFQDSNSSLLPSGAFGEPDALTVARKQYKKGRREKQARASGVTGLDRECNYLDLTYCHDLSFY